MAWTDDRVAELKRLHGLNLSAAMIARGMGGITRNAVIGKLHRLGIRYANHNPPRPIERKPREPRDRLTRIKSPAINASTAIIERPAGPFLNIPLIELEPHQCKYPIGDGPFFFCGQPRIADSPYCSRCHRLCYRPANPPNPQYFPQFKRKAA